MSQPNILVAGATGTNGRELLSQLSAQGIKARALVRNLASAESLQNEHISLVQGDLSDKNSLASAFEGIEKAYIVTAIHQDTLQWFANFFDAAKAAGVKQVVKFSGLGADVNSPSEVIRQHGASDKLLMESGLNYTILRPNSFYQNMFWQAESIKASGQFYLPLKDARQSLVDVRDIAEATVKILTEEGHENKAYNLTGPESLGFDDVALVLSEVLGKEIHYIPVPVEAAEQSMLDAGMPEWDAHVLAEIQDLFATGKYAKPESDLEKLLGHKPLSFKDFATDFASVFGG